jgi:hypothetical protein
MHSRPRIENGGETDRDLVTAIHDGRQNQRRTSQVSFPRACFNTNISEYGRLNRSMRRVCGTSHSTMGTILANACHCLTTPLRFECAVPCISKATKHLQALTSAVRSMTGQGGVAAVQAGQHVGKPPVLDRRSLYGPRDILVSATPYSILPRLRSRLDTRRW